MLHYNTFAILVNMCDSCISVTWLKDTHTVKIAENISFVKEFHTKWQGNVQ